MQPAGNGAWLCKNSWGNYLRGDGYFWLSYYDASLINSNVYFYDVTAKSEEIYDNNYCYDGCGSFSYYTAYDTGSMANIFTADSNEILKAVSFFTEESNDNCIVKIYKNINSNNNPTSGNLVYTSEEIPLLYAGYHTVELTQEISLNQNEKYSVVIQINNEGNSIELLTEYSMNYGWAINKASSNTGESFIKYDSYWMDIGASGKGNVRIKAFTNESDKPVTGVNIEEDTAEVVVGYSNSLTTSVLPSNARNKNVTFTCSDERVATVDSSGVVTGVSVGKATITVKTSEGNFTDTCLVTVTNNFVKVVSVSLSKTWETIEVTDQLQLKASIYPENATNKKVTFSSNNSNVASVSENGLVTGKASGTAIISVTTENGGKIASCTISVKDKNFVVTGVSLSSKKLSLIANTTSQLVATVLPDEATNKKVYYYSSDNSIASVNSQGLVTAVSEGTAYITVTTEDGGYTDYCEISVLENKIKVSYIYVEYSYYGMLYPGSKIYTQATVWPTNAANKNLVYTSTNENVAVVDKNGVITMTGIGTASIIIRPEDGSNCVCSFTLIGQYQPVTVSYRTHVQNVGWQNYVSNGMSSGTVGRSLRLEGININVSGNSNLGITYSTHVQNVGWQNYVSNGEMSGTSGRSLRLEAIKIKLTGTAADYYDVYYRVHAQDYGWLDWAKNGEAAGTEGFSKRLEGIQIKIVQKGLGSFVTTRPFVSAYGNGNVTYQTHVQNVGWQNYVKDGFTSGTSGRSLRLEGIRIRLGANMPSGSINYQTHVQNIGWQSTVSNGTMSGTSGRSLRLEAIKITLSGEVAQTYDVYYRVHAQDYGWLDWAKNGQMAGTSGCSKRLEAIQIVLVPKGGAAPGSTNRPAVIK